MLKERPTATENDSSFPNDSSDKNTPKQNGTYKKNMLVFNIGPSLIHLLNLNRYSGKTINYLFDYSNFVSTPENRYTEKHVSTKRVTIHKRFSKVDNAEKSAVIKINIFRGKCLCVKCLEVSYMYYGVTGKQLRYELMDMLCSEICRNWDDKWLRILIEQSSLFFCSIKDGIVYERILESACLCAEMLLVKNPIKDLIEIKHGYTNFSLNFLYRNRASAVRLQNNRTTVNESFNRKVESFKTFSGTGKEELDVIDGVSVLSFKTEADMNEYTDLQLRYFNIMKSTSQTHVNDNGAYIKPSKTTGITKIKGWRNKVFSPLTPYTHNKKTTVYENRNTETVLVEKFEKNNPPNKRSLKKTEKNIVKKIKLGKENSFKKVSLDSFPDDERSKYLFEEDMKIVEVTPKQCLNYESKTASEICVKSHISSVVLQENTSTDQFHEVNLESVEKAKEHDVRVTNSVFESDALDGFLKNNSTLNSSHEIPALLASESQMEAEIQNDIVDPAIKSEKQNDNDIEEEEYKKEYVPEQKKELCGKELTIKQPSEVNNAYPAANLIKIDCNNLNTRYTCVQGRPIQVLNGEKKSEFTLSKKNLELPPLVSACFKTCEKSLTEFLGFDVDVSDSSNQVKKQSDSRRPRLLTSIAIEETDFALKKLEPPYYFGPTYIPVTHSCSSNSKSINHRTCYCRTFSLGMVLHIEKGRKLCKEAVENLEALKPGDNLIDMRMAAIAASAVAKKTSHVECTRVIVPVVLGRILKIVKNWKQRLCYDRIAETVPTGPVELDPEVQRMVNGLITFKEKLNQ